jgi:plastocyanin
MTQVIRRYGRFGLVFVALTVGVALVLPLVAERAPAPREIVLVARGMTFVLDGSPAAVNPALHLSPGERVRFVLRNETAGIVHDFAVPAWNVAMDPVDGGHSGAVTFTVPGQPGTFVYECRPHAQMMRGTLEVGTR